MSLSSPTIDKFFRENFSGERPLQVDPERREALAEQIRERLVGLDSVRVETHPYVREEEKARFVCAFSITEPSDHRYYEPGRLFFLSLDEQNRLTLRAVGTAGVLVSSLDEVLGFVARCRERVARRQAQKSKRQKVRNLRARAVIALVTRLAREEKFDFFTESNVRALKLYVKLSEKECIELDVPFHGFEQTLAHLREAILALRALHQRGLRFRLCSLSAWRRDRRDWVRHETLKS